jgi:hypothetical protein
MMGLIKVKKHTTSEFLTKLTLFLFCLCNATFAIAEEILPGHLKIELVQNGEKKEGEKAAKKSWSQGCNQIGKSLTVGQGPWGFGAFTSYSCYVGKTKLSGENRQTPWLLKVTKNSDGLVFSMTFKGDELSSVKVPPSDSFFDYLKDGEFIDHISYVLLDGLPIGMVVSKAMVGGNPPTFAGRHWRAGTAKAFKFSVPDPPEEIVLYRLNWDADSKSWQSVVVGSAKKQKVVPPTSVKVKKKKMLKGGQVIYEVGPEVVEALALGPLWGQNAQGPGARKEELEGNLVQSQKALDQAADAGYLKEFLDGKQGIVEEILKSAASGYIGMRYGLQVLPAAGSLGRLLNKTRLFSLLLEIRGGPVKGLRYYYDKLPETKLSVIGASGEKTETRIAFARHVIGYSFGFDPGFLVDRVTLDPKLGMWNFDATMPVSEDEDGNVLAVQRFQLGKTFSLALEAGLERLARWYTLRGWVAVDTGFSLLKSKGKVTSERLGIDTYFNTGPKFTLFGAPIKTALMGFYVYENVTIKMGTSPASESASDSITGLNYSVGYAGGGVALSW